MSELSERVARDHAWVRDRFPGGCACGVEMLLSRQHAPHVAAMTEAAVRETIAASISRMGVAIRYPDCEIPLEPSTVRDIATRIARGET